MGVKTDTGLPARLRPSPNHNERTVEVSLLLLHYTGMTSGEDAPSESAPMMRASSATN